MEGDIAFAYPKCIQLNCNHQDGTIEQPKDIEKAARDTFGDDYSAVLILRATLPFDVPIFNCPNYVALVERPIRPPTG